MIKNKKYLILILVTLLALSGGALAYIKNRGNKNSDTTTTDANINYSPPTDQEKKDAEDNKKIIDERESQRTSSEKSSHKTVKPVIVSYGQVNDAVKVSARVPGVFEGDGTCTLTLTKNGVKVSQNKNASQNVSEMSCGFISISRSKLTAGDWSATVSYKSSKTSGTSASVVVEVK